jgi:hypothetical protein
VLAEQTAAVDPSRLRESVGYLSLDEVRRVEAALRIVMELWWMIAGQLRSGVQNRWTTVENGGVDR